MIKRELVDSYCSALQKKETRKESLNYEVSRYSIRLHRLLNAAAVSAQHGGCLVPEALMVF
jgi:hypothetical protein